MKKFLYLLVLFGVIWLVKLSYDTFLLSKQITGIQETLHKTEQQNANLNDQLVAIQRKLIEPTAQIASIPNSNTNVVAEKQQLNASLYLKQELALVQFALEQQQFSYALEKLNHFDFNLEKYVLAEALKQTLHQSVEQDRKAIQAYVLAKNSKLAQLDDVLYQLDLSLKAEQSNTQLNVPVNSQAYFWQKWFRLDVVDQQNPTLLHRQQVLKEVQIRILLAQQALTKGQFLEYQTIIGSVLGELNGLPDQFSQKLKQRLLTLKQTQMQPVPKLSSAAILE